MDQLLAKGLLATFKNRFGSIPLLIWSPGRINLIGEHTDYNLGYVLPAAIDRGICLALQRSEGRASTWIASDTGETYQPDEAMETLVRPAGWIAYFHGILAELQKRGSLPGPFNLIFSGNIPPGAGLSSSAALENAFVFGLNELFKLGLSKLDMVHISHTAEQDFIGLQCGIMDPFAGMFGKAGGATFLDCRSLKSEWIPLPMAGYQWLLLDTGVKHNLAETAYNERRNTCEAVAMRLGLPSLRELSFHRLESERNKLPEDAYDKARFILEENARVLRAVDAIKKEDLPELGQLMYHSHQGLQLQYQVSCEELDFLVDLAREREGIIGARMMGGGFGGCTLNLVRQELVQSLTENFEQAYYLRFQRRLTPFSVSVADGCRLVDEADLA